MASTFSSLEGATTGLLRLTDEPVAAARAAVDMSAAAELREVLTGFTPSLRYNENHEKDGKFGSGGAAPKETYEQQLARAKAAAAASGGKKTAAQIMNEENAATTKAYQKAEREAKKAAKDGPQPAKPVPVPSPTKASNLPAIDRVDHGILTSAAQQDAFSHYVGSGGEGEAFSSNEINDYLRGQSPGTPQIKAAVSDMKAAIGSNSLNRDALLFRGVRSGWGDIQGTKAGAVIEMKGFVSTSTDKTIAADFGGNKDGYWMQIDAKKGTPAVSPSKAFTGEDFGAEEILLNTGSKYQLTGIDHKTKTVSLRAL